MKKLFTFVSLLLTPLFAMAAFPAQLNNFQPGNVIRSSDWNSIESEIGTRIGSVATGTRETINWVLRNTSFASSSLFVGKSSTTTISGDGATSTFSGGIFGTRPRFSELNASNCDVKASTNGTFYCGLDSGSGSSFLYPFPNNATSTILQFTNGFISLASSTIQTLNLSGISGVLKMSGNTVVGSASTSDLPEGSNLYYTLLRFASALAGTTTDALIEGSTNQYFTTARARSAVAGLFPATTTSNTWALVQTFADISATNATTTSLAVTGQASSTILTASRQFFGANLSTCSTALTWTGGVFSCNSSLTSASSTLLSDGNNWSGLNRYSAGIISSASSTFQFVNLGNATSTNFETTQIKIGVLSGVLKASNGGVTGSASTSDLPEGSNSYWTSLRATTSVSSLIAGTTTTALAEGSNLYYTAQRVRDLIQSAGTLLVSTTTAQTWNALQTFTTISLTSGTSTSFATTQATSSYETISKSLNLNWLATGLLKVTNGSVGLATAGTDYENPLTFSTSGTGLNLWNARSGNTVSFNSIAAGTNVTLSTTTNSNTIVISSTGGGASFNYPFTNTTLGGSTSTLIAFTNGLISLASSTFQTLNFGTATGTSATTTNLHTNGQVVMQSNSTTTINGVNIAGLGGSGTSTFSNAGINLLEGCYAKNGTCVTTNAASGANGAVQFANGGSVSGDANWFFWDNTNKRLGIGTSSPFARLAVGGQVVADYFTATSTATSTFRGVRADCFSVDGVSCIGAAGGSYSGSGASGQVTFWTGASSFSGSNNFVWDNTNARLGLGTTSPWAKLSIVDTDATRPAFVLATSSDISSTGIFAEFNSQLSLFRNKDWWNIHLGGSTSSARFAMNGTTMFGRTNSDTLMVQVDPMNSATVPTQVTGDTIIDGGVIFDELTDGAFGVTTLATSSDYRGQASGCYDGGAWNYIRANELAGAIANEGGWLRGSAVFNMRTSVGAVPTAVAGGTMVASGTPVMEVTICAPTVASVLAGSSTAIMQGLFGFGFGDTAGGSGFMSSSLGGPANGSWIGASTSDNWLFYSADRAIAVGNDTGVATATTKTTARTFRIAKTATATYAYIFNNNTGLWESIGAHTTRQTSREFTWFIGTQLPGATGVRHDLLFRNLRVWYSPSYRF